MRFHVLIASVGRTTLLRLLEQLAIELRDGDMVTVVFDGVDVDIEEYRTRYPMYSFIREEMNLGGPGHGVRTKYQGALDGDYILNMDDDDLYTKGFRNTLKRVLERECLPDILVCNWYRVKDSNTTLGLLTKLRPITVNTVGKNIESITNEPWDTVYNGDLVRWEKLMSMHRTARTDFVLVDKY